MTVEKYFNKELADITFGVEALDEWKKTCEDLGLDNQLILTKGKESPIPFPFMNEVMQRVYETLCPRKVTYKSYDKTTIPLEVLKQIQFAVRDRHFADIQIWYDDKSPDPIVVGLFKTYIIRDKDSWSNKLKDGTSTTLIFNCKVDAENYLDTLEDKAQWRVDEKETTEYLIARWGDELRDFAELKKLAITRFMEEHSGNMQKQLVDLQHKIKTLKENTVQYFNGTMSEYEVTRA